MNIFTFWEGQMPDYIKLCMKTWKFRPIVLNYRNLNDWTNLPVDKLKTFTLPQVSDAVRAHVLRDHIGSYWLDTDTIFLNDTLPKENVIGDPIARTHSTGVSHSTKESIDFFTAWAEYQDNVIANPNHSKHWSVLVNMFTDTYVPNHKEVTIYDISICRPELYMIPSGSSSFKYKEFYFGNHKSYSISDLRDRTDFLVLHNSWTPAWYKQLDTNSVLSYNCTLSNILKETLENA